MKIRRLVASAFLQWLLLLTLALRVHATTYFVATNCSDGAAVTSWATARQTIQAAIDLTVSIVTVLVIRPSGLLGRHGARRV